MPLTDFHTSYEFFTEDSSLRHNSELTWMFPYLQLASSDEHHKSRNIKPSLNNYSIYEKYINNSQSEKTQIKSLSRS